MSMMNKSDEDSSKKLQTSIPESVHSANLLHNYNHVAKFAKPTTELEVMSFTCDPYEFERNRRKRQQKTLLMEVNRGPRICDIPKSKTKNPFSDSLKNVPIFLIKNKIIELNEKYGVDEHYLFSTEKVLEWDPKCYKDPNDFLDLLLDFEESLEKSEKRSQQSTNRTTPKREQEASKNSCRVKPGSHEARLAKQLEENERQTKEQLQAALQLKEIEIEKRRKKNSEELDKQIKKQANEDSTLENLTINLSKSLDADKVYLITNHSKRSILFVNTKFKDGDVKKKRYPVPECSAEQLRNRVSLDWIHVSSLLTLVRIIIWT